MDDNNFATSEASHEDSYFATEVEQDTAPVVENDAPEAEAEVEAPADEGSKLPKAPKSTREALERAFDETKKAERDPSEVPESTIPKEPPPLEIGAPKNLNAPASWDPAAREAWGTLPDAVKETIAKREYEAAATLTKSTAERRLAYEFMNIAQPYAAEYQAMGVNPLAAVQNFFQIDKALRVGSTAQKAQLVGNLIKQYGVDLGALDSHLAGQVVPEQTRPGYDPELAARLDRVENYARNQQQSVVQAQQNQINNTIDQFANDSKNEFFNDVAPHMIGLLQSGAAPDLKTAYEQACFANPQVRQVLTQRQQSDKARLAAGSASLPNKGPRNGSAVGKQKFSSTRDALEAAFAAADKQRRV